MTTIFDFRPEVAEALANGSLDVGLAEKVRALLRRDVDRIVELIVPLTWVESLTEAEAHTDTVVVEFSRLLMRVAEKLPRTDVSPRAADLTQMELERGEPLLHSADERWKGILQSEAACADWFARQALKVLDGDASRKIAQLNEQTRRPQSRFVMAKCALIAALTSADGASPETVSALTQLADDCMSEVEDVFLAQADYSEDDGETVSLAEVRAKLGL